MPALFLNTVPCWPSVVLDAYYFVVRMFNKALIYLTTLLASSTVLSQNGVGVGAQYLLGLGTCWSRMFRVTKLTFHVC